MKTYYSEELNKTVGYEVLTAVVMDVAIIWDIAQTFRWKVLSLS
jgi:hypothetical protein